MAPSNSLDTILNQITTSNNPVALNHTLRTTLPKESRDTILASTLSSGQDPLIVLDVRENTVGVLWILAARLNTQTSTPPPWPLIQQFCHTFIPEQARLAPDRVHAFGRGIVAYAAASPNPKVAIEPLSNLIQRYSPDASYLTSLHSIFALACVSTHSFTALLPVLASPITNIDLGLSPDLVYNDSLMYHYLGGIALAALKKWSEAQEFFEIAISVPGTVPAALQLEALKKLKLVQLIATGTTAPLPKYTAPLLPRLFKNTPYSTFINAYPHNTSALQDCITQHASTFLQEKNTGLVQLAFSRAPRWTLKKLTSTYVTLSLSDIAKAIKIPSEDDVRALLLDMIESNDISAQISADGTVTFSDPSPTFSQAQVDAVLKDVQRQADLLHALEREMAKSKDYLNKAVKTRDDSAWVPTTEEDIFSMTSAGMWVDEPGFV